ncbi:hypothetical protein ACFL3G_09855 [Planctomycetota bacterium]
MTKEEKNSTSLNLEKPPVVEAWIEFYFDLSEEEIPWTEADATTFIKESCTDYVPKGCEYFAKIRFDSNGKPDFTKTDESFSRIKAFTKDGQYCIQASRNALIFNQINKGDWPGYEIMRNKAFEVLGKYSNYRHFENLLNICLHYRDIISIPREGEEIELKDYFKIYPHLEESFGDFCDLKLDLVLPQSPGEGVTFFSFLGLPRAAGCEDFFKFQMDWHINPYDSSIMCFEEAKDWLNLVHSNLIERFEGAFTSKTMELFRGKKI